MSCLNKLEPLTLVLLLAVAFCLAKKDFGEPCTSNVDCSHGLLCSKETKTCSCWTLTDYNVGEKVDQLYYMGMCFSKPGQKCTLPEDHGNSLIPIECVPNAVCINHENGTGSREVFGKCSCKKRFVPNEKSTMCIIATGTVGALQQQLKSSATSPNEILNTSDTVSLNSTKWQVVFQVKLKRQFRAWSSLCGWNNLILE